MWRIWVILSIYFMCHSMSRFMRVCSAYLTLSVCGGLVHFLFFLPRPVWPTIICLLYSLHKLMSIPSNISNEISSGVCVCVHRYVYSISSLYFNQANSLRFKVIYFVCECKSSCPYINRLHIANRSEESEKFSLTHSGLDIAWHIPWCDVPCSPTNWLTGWPNCNVRPCFINLLVV